MKEVNRSSGNTYVQGKEEGTTQITSKIYMKRMLYVNCLRKKIINKAQTCQLILIIQSKE